MKSKNHLPLIGVGPVYGIVCIILTLAAIIVGLFEPLKSGVISVLRIPFFIIGAVLIIFGVYLWVSANFRSGLGKNIKENVLITTGVYSLVRNPVYSAFMFMCTGALFIAGNCYFCFLPFVYWIYMTLLMKNTEEKWLEALYGDEYRNYKKSVNRCIPFPRRKG